MIKRALIVCIAAVLAWHLVMPRLGRGYYSIPGQQRANYLHAQQFVHEAPADARVITGSSMADRLNEFSLGKDHVKLTFPGGGPFTGLELIRGTGRKPPVVWIEINVILRDAEMDLIGDALASWRRGLREASPVFKEEGRPSEFGIGFLKAVVGKACKAGEKLTGPPTAEESPMDQAVFEDIMKGNRVHLDQKPRAEELAARIRKMGELVDELTRAGSKCVFFEMPFDASLTDLAEPAAIRKAMQERFPADKYLWLDLSRAAPWKTTDGIHLQPQEAELVVRRMLEFEKTLK